MKNIFLFFLFIGLLSTSFETQAQSGRIKKTSAKNSSSSEIAMLEFSSLEGLQKKPKAPSKEYVASNGEVFRVGETIKIGKPSQHNDLFKNVVESDGWAISDFASIHASGWDAEIKKFKIAGTKRMGYSVTAVCKNETGLMSYYISIEKALSSGEIVSTKMNRDQAIAKLKEAKDLLDIEMMTQEEFDKLKEELTPIIKG